MDTSHVLEHGTSVYVRILEEYGSVSCDFSFAIRLNSHSVSNSHTLLPKRSIYEKLKVTFGTPVQFPAFSLSNRIFIARNHDFHKSRYHCVGGFIMVVIIYHIRQTL